MFMIADPNANSIGNFHTAFSKQSVKKYDNPDKL